MLNPHIIANEIHHRHLRQVWSDRIGFVDWVRSLVTELDHTGYITELRVDPSLMQGISSFLVSLQLFSNRILPLT